MAASVDASAAPIPAAAAAPAVPESAMWLDTRALNCYEGDAARRSWLLTPGLLTQRMGQVQELGRLLSTRQQTVSLAGRSRLVLPEGFRDFLAVEAGGSLMVVGAAVCVELWQPAAWNAYVTSEMPGFRQRIDDLTA